MLQELVKSGDMASAYLLFTPEFKKERAPALDDFKKRLEADGKLICSGAVRKVEEEYDTARAIVGYGDKFIYVHFAVVDEIEPSGKVWQITTPAHYETVKNSTSPKKTLYFARLAVLTQKNADIKDFFTPAAASNEEIAGLMPLLLKNWNRTQSASYRASKHWALWQRAYSVEGEIRTLPVCFVNRGGKWLFCTPAEFEQAIRLYGEE